MIFFVAKYTPNGALQWVTSAGGASSEEGYGIAADPAGNTYVTGQFTGSATFGAGEPNETELTTSSHPADYVIFVAKYAPDGSLLWAKSAGSPDADIGRGIATEGNGNSYVTGIFRGTTTFGAGEANETVLTQGGVFVAKYAADGILLWATRVGAGEAHGIATDGGGNAYVIATFGDISVAKYAPDGTLQWVTTAGGAGGTSYGFGIAATPAGYSYVTGAFTGTVIFGAGESNETMLADVDTDDIFIVKYAPDGTLQWATSAGGAGGDSYGTGIATDGRGSSYVTGFFGGTAVFGEGQTTESVFTGGGFFVAKYSARALEDDRDRDGVADSVDFCAGTELPEAVPTSGRLLPTASRSPTKVRRSRPMLGAPAKA